MDRRRRQAIAVLMLVLAVGAAPAVAKNPHPPTVASCTVSGTTVTATGLPTTELVNFLQTNASGTTGWVLGYTPDGTWNVTVPAATASTTYQFVSKTWGPDGSKYTVFTSC
jgi:hypothetical protein